jgi:hypothetical protein
MMKENYHAEGKGRSPQTFPRRAVLQGGGGVVCAEARSSRTKSPKRCRSAVISAE